MVDHKNIRRCRRLYSLHNSYTAIGIRDLKRARKLKLLLVVCAMAIQQIDEDADEDEDYDGDIKVLQDIFRVILFRRRRLTSPAGNETSYCILLRALEQRT